MTNELTMLQHGAKLYDYLNQTVESWPDLQNEVLAMPREDLEAALLTYVRAFKRKQLDDRWDGPDNPSPQSEWFSPHGPRI